MLPEDVGRGSPKGKSDRIEEERAEPIEYTERWLQSTNSEEQLKNERRVVRVEDFFLLITVSSVFWLVAGFDESSLLNG